MYLMVNFPPKLPESVQRINFLTKAYILKILLFTIILHIFIIFRLIQIIALLLYCKKLCKLFSKNIATMLHECMGEIASMRF